MPRIRTIIVDDSLEFLHATMLLLSSDPFLQIDGQYASARDALEKVDLSNTDLVLMDLAMPEVNGLEATGQIKADPNSPKVILLTMHDNQEYRRAASMAGAEGFVAKSEMGSQLLPLIYQLFNEEYQTNP